MLVQVNSGTMTIDPKQIQYVRLPDGSFQAIVQQPLAQQQSQQPSQQQPPPLQSGMPQALATAPQQHQQQHQQQQQQQQQLPPSNGNVAYIQGPNGIPMQVIQAPQQGASQNVPGGGQQHDLLGPQGQGMQPMQPMSSRAPAGGPTGSSGIPSGDMMHGAAGQGGPVLNEPPPAAKPQQPLNVPANAVETLYVDDIPMDMSKRELAHIFRPFGGYKARWSKL